MRLAALGLGLGLVASTQTGRVLSARLWGVQPLDPVAFCAAAVVLGLAALVACWAPAVRATRVDPVDVLAAE
jgi:ABC-type lipoprotein release transport system permease subunit